MGTASSTFKMLPILALLPGLLAAEVIQRSLQIEEGGTSYTQTVTFDFDNRVQIIDVPAHNNIVHSRSHFYFNQGKVVESHPDHGNCYVKPMPLGIASMEKLAAVLGKRVAMPMKAKEQKVVHRSFATSRRIPVHEINDLPEAFSECKNSHIYAVEHIPNTFHSNKTFTHASAETVEEVQGSLRSGSCAFPSDCLWQTCWVGSDSCFWTVNCPANDYECDDMIHNGDFHVNDDPITCKACFNTACPGCEEAWENSCGSGSEMGHGIKACENGDVQEGWDCGRKRCEWPNNEKFADATFECPQDHIENGYVLSGNMCFATCGNGRPGGAVLCQEDTTWDEHGMWCPEL